MDFQLTDSQRALQETARKYAREVIRPKAAHYDETGDFPRDLISMGYELGMMNLGIPAEVGGHASYRIPGQESQAPGVSAPHGPEEERSDAEDQTNRVQKPVGYPHPPRSAAQIAPVRESGHGGPERSHNPNRERSVGRVFHGH